MLHILGLSGWRKPVYHPSGASGSLSPDMARLFQSSCVPVGEKRAISTQVLCAVRAAPFCRFMGHTHCTAHWDSGEGASPWSCLGRVARVGWVSLFRVRHCCGSESGLYERIARVPASCVPSCFYSPGVIFPSLMEGDHGTGTLAPRQRVLVFLSAVWSPSQASQCAV